MTDSPEERDEFLQIYLEESVEETEALVKLLLQLEQDPDDVETLREAFRMLHTFKGSTGMMGFERVNALAHELETRFDACRSRRERMTTETVSVSLRCIDFFRDFLTRLSVGNDDQGDPTPLIEELNGIETVVIEDEPSEPFPSPKASSGPSAEDASAEDASAEDASAEDASAEDASAEVEPESATKAQSAPELEPISESAEESAEKPVAKSAEDSTAEPARALDGKPSPSPSAAAPRRVVPSSSSSASGPVRDVLVRVGLSDRVELPDLKVRLIVARLQALGEVISVDPPLDTIEHAPHPITLNIRARSASDDRVLADSLDLEGVASVRIGDSAGGAAAPSGAATTRQESPAVKAESEATSSVTPQPPSTGLKEAKRTAPSRAGETIRVGIDRLDRLMNLAGELVVTNARFDQLADEMRLLFRSGGSIEAGSPLAESLLRAMAHHGDTHASEDVQGGFAGERITGIIGNDGGSEEGAALRRGWMERGRRVTGQVSETVDQLARLSRSIQQAVLETRMVPIGPMFNRFRRTVRDIAMKQHKQVSLDLEGEMTELDKRMVDELGDPMVHLIRNSLDHGIESTDVRLRRGKPAEGLIQLRAYHQSNHVVIEIEDDGAGIDAGKVRSRALERGLATEAELKMMSDREVYGYIWHAGFSTADQISEISGRGVGMDVVRDRIASLGGVVELTSRPGVGSTVSIRLPLTLAIVNAMIVRFRGFRLAIPVTDVYEICGLSRAEIFESQGREMIDVRGTLLPLYTLDELFTWNDYLPPRCKKRDALVQAVLVRHGHRCLAIEVDDLDGNADIVIKSLDDHFSHVPGLGGACVMGDGEVCLVLDTASLGIKRRQDAVQSR